VFKSLRNRLILSHTLPILIAVPLMGILLLYVLETRYLVPDLSKDLTNDARLLANLAGNQTSIWQDPAYAGALLNGIYPNRDTRVMLLRLDGTLLASTDAEDASRLNQVIPVKGLLQAEGGQIYEAIQYSSRLDGSAIDILAPVYSPDHSLIGFISITHRYITLPQSFWYSRYIIVGIIALGLLAGVLLGTSLAISISTPIRRVGQAIIDLTGGDYSHPLAEQGLQEIDLLSQAVNLLVERLHNLEQARRRLLANLVHELGRPLGALQAGTQALLSGARQDPDLLTEMLQGMNGEIAILQRLLDDLAHLHGQELGTLELDREEIAVNDWLARSLLPWQEAARKKHLHWQVSLPSDSPTIEADPVRLGQVLGNLVSNAIKYTSPGGTVSISAGIKGQEIWIRVSDNGPGIPPEEQEKIFSPFYRGKQATRFPQGMGLGLSIARDLVAAHLGRLELQSTPGLGSHFTIWIPTGSPIPYAPARPTSPGIPSPIRS
jgi:two-component system sensor histidine kinase BaeS